jgi:hypothetical protein
MSPQAGTIIESTYAPPARFRGANVYITARIPVYVGAQHAAPELKKSCGEAASQIDPKRP